MASDIGAEFRMDELEELADWQLWALGGAIVTRLEAAIRPVVGDGWQLGELGVDAVWTQVDVGDGDAPSMAAVLGRFDALDTDGIRAPIDGLWLVEALKVAVLNMLDPGGMPQRVALASGTAIEAWELFAEYEMQDERNIGWSEKYSSLPVLAEIGAQRVDATMVRLGWERSDVREVLRSRAAAVGSWLAGQVAMRGRS